MVSCSQRWYAVYTRGRFEKAVCQRLEDKGVQCYLPLYRARRRWSDRTVAVDMPLFPSYLFARVGDDPAGWFTVVDTKGVVSLVSSGSGPVPIPDETVAAVGRILDSGLSVQPLPWLKAGTRVRVVAGPLCDLEGEIDSCGRNGRLFVSIRAIGQSVTVDIDMSDVIAI